MSKITIPALLIRGGTSKGLFFNEADLPPAGEKRDRLLLSIMGSPDPSGMQDELPKQIDFKVLEPMIHCLGKAAAEIMKIPYNAALRIAWVSSSKNPDVNIVSRISTEGRMHHAYTGTGAINLACAAKIPGTIPFKIVQKTLKSTNENAAINIAHPSGIMQVNAIVVKNNSGKWIAQSSVFIRTAKIIMAGEVFA